MSRTIRSGNHARPSAVEEARRKGPSKVEGILQSMDYNSLRKAAKERGLEFKSVPKKDELVKALAG